MSAVDVLWLALLGLTLIDLILAAWLGHIHGRRDRESISAYERKRRRPA